MFRHHACSGKPTVNQLVPESDQVLSVLESPFLRKNFPDEDGLGKPIRARMMMRSVFCHCHYPSC